MRRGLCFAMVGLSLAGCSRGDEAAPKPIRGSAKEVAAVVARLDDATRARRFAEICDQLLSPAARERAGGEDCERLLREAARDVRRPRVRLVSIRVAGANASARVRSTSAGQAPVDETLDLVREGAHYRIASLSP